MRLSALANACTKFNKDNFTNNLSSAPNEKMKQSKNSKLIVENGIKGDVLLFPGEVENNGAGIKGINKTLTT